MKFLKKDVNPALAKAQFHAQSTERNVNRELLISSKMIRHISTY